MVFHIHRIGRNCPCFLKFEIQASWVLRHPIAIWFLNFLSPDICLISRHFFGLWKFWFSEKSRFHTLTVWTKVIMGHIKLLLFKMYVFCLGFDSCSDYTKVCNELLSMSILQLFLALMSDAHFTIFAVNR